jgi:hypothetical protein
MTKEFSEAIRSFHRDIGQKRGMNATLTGMNTSTLTTIRSDCQSVVICCARLARYHYLTNTQFPVSFEDSLIPLQEFKILGLGEGLRLFEKAGHKDRFCHLADLLMKDPQLFAEIVYLALVSADCSLEVKPSNSLSGDDRVRFVFGTLPALYNFFLSQVDRVNGLALVQSIVRLHVYLHGCHFSESHRFVTDIVFSFFLATNPGHFFEVAVHRMMPGLLPRALGGRHLGYAKVSSTLAREPYVVELVEFCEGLLGRMREYIGLLPSAAIALIHAVAAIDQEEFPIMRAFVFENLFLAYIQRYIPLARADILRDVADILRCYYPQAYCQSRLYGVVQELLPKVETSSMDSFFNTLLGQKDEESSLTGAFVYSGRMSMLTGRDFHLFYCIVQYFREYAGRENPVAFNTILAGLGAPQSDNDNRYLPLVAWNSSPGKGKLDLEDTRQLEEVLDALDSIEISGLEFDTPDELIEKLTRYTDPFIDVHQRLRLETQPDLLFDQSTSLTAFNANSGKLHQYGISLESDLYEIRARLEKEREQLARMQMRYIQDTVLPALMEQDPELAFRPDDLDGSESKITRLTVTLKARLTEFTLTLDAAASVQRVFHGRYVDQMGECLRKSTAGSARQYARVFSEHVKLNGNFLRRGPRASYDAFKAAALPFHEIDCDANLQTVLTLIVRAMRPLQRMNDRSLALTMAMSTNSSLIALRLFLVHTLVKQDFLMQSLLGQEAVGLIERFCRVIAIIQPTAPPFLV